MMELVLKIWNCLYREMTMTLTVSSECSQVWSSWGWGWGQHTQQKLLNTDNPDIIEAVKKGCVGDTVHCYPDHQTSSHPPALPSPGPCQGQVMLQHGHQADGEPCAHQMEGQVGEGWVDEDPGHVDDQAILATHGDVEQVSARGGHARHLSEIEKKSCHSN